MNDAFDGYLDAVTYIEREFRKLGITGKVDFGKKFSMEDISDFGEAVNYGTFKLSIPENTPLTEALESNIKSFLKSKSKTFEDAILNINAELGDKAFSSELWNKFEPETVIRLSDAIDKYGFRLDINEPLESNINRFLKSYDELEKRFNSEFEKRNDVKDEGPNKDFKTRFEVSCDIVKIINNNEGKNIKEIEFYEKFLEMTQHFNSSTIKLFGDEIIKDNSDYAKNLKESNITESISLYRDNLLNRKDFIDIVKTESPEIVVGALIDYASVQRLTVPEKTQDRWVELVNSGEKIENIKGYIDNYSRSIGLPHFNNEIENRNQYIKCLTDLSDKTGVSERVIHSIAQDYLKDSVNSITQFNNTLKKLPEMENDYFSINNFSKACSGHGIEVSKVQSLQNGNLTTDQIKAYIVMSSAKEFSKDPENFVKKMESVNNGPRIGKELADFMDEVYHEFHSGYEKNVRDERGIAL